MKHFLTLTALLISSLVMGQNDPFWNPDANGDDLIGFTDLASLLSVYNSSVGIDSSVTCEFSGSDLEQFTLDLLTQTIAVDSVFFEFELSGQTNEYTLGCPDPVVVPWTYAASGTATSSNSHVSDDYMEFWISRNFDNGGSTEMYFYAYRISPNDPWEIFGAVAGYVNFGGVSGSVGQALVGGVNIPTQYGNVVWDSLGVHNVEIELGNFVRAIPYWHYNE